MAERKTRRVPPTIDVTPEVVGERAPPPPDPAAAGQAVPDGPFGGATSGSTGEPPAAAAAPGEAGGDSAAREAGAGGKLSAKDDAAAPAALGEPAPGETKPGEAKSGEAKPGEASSEPPSSGPVPGDAGLVEGHGEASAAPEGSAPAGVAADEPKPRWRDEAGAAAAAAALRPPPRRFPYGAVALASLLGGLVGALAALYLPGFIGPADQTPEKLANLERSLEAQRAAAAKRTDLEGLDKRVAALAGQVTQAAQVAQAVQAAQAAQAAQKPEPVAAGDAAGNGRLDNARLEAVEGAVKAMDPQALKAAGETSLKVATLEERMAALEKAAAAGRGDVASRAVVAASLVRAVEAGAPYAGELQALAGLGVDAARLAPLKDGAAQGLPSPAALARQFTALSGQILASVSPAGATFLDRLAASASQVVRVRPVGEAAGVDPPATVARIEAALSRGALADALKEWKTLPEPGRRVSEAWAKALEARVAADNAARGLLADTVAALGARPQSN